MGAGSATVEESRSSQARDAAATEQLQGKQRSASGGRAGQAGQGTGKARGNAPMTSLMSGQG